MPENSGLKEDPIKELEAALKLFREAEQRLKIVTDELNECNDEQLDIEHDIELVRHSHNELGHIAEHLRDVRRRRRIAKNAADVLTPLVEWTKSNPIKLNELTKTLGEMRRAQEIAERRSYMCRGERRGQVLSVDKQ